MSLLYTRIPSPIGEILLTQKSGALTGLYLAGQRYYPSLPADAEEVSTPLFAGVELWLGDYFAGKNPDVAAIPLAPEGCAFRQRVWAELLKIPCGTTTSYGALAERLHSSPRAVGGAVGHNPISVLIPCHRVLSANGEHHGYAGGLERKAYLLKLESACRQERREV